MVGFRGYRRGSSSCAAACPLYPALYRASATQFAFAPDPSAPAKQRRVGADVVLAQVDARKNGATGSPDSRGINIASMHGLLARWAVTLL